MRTRDLYNRLRYSLIIKGILHTIAMNMPHDKLSVHFYRLRGTKIGKNVGINQGVFLEEARPDLITIHDNAQLGYGVLIATHDSSKHLLNPKKPIEHGRVTIGRNAFVGQGAIILPNVTIGDFAVVGAGAVVTKNVPPRTVVAGVPAKQIGIITSKGEIVIRKSK